jgi:ATP-binding cassette, subfamily B, bacterial
VIDFVFYGWPPERVNEALATLAQAAGMGPHAQEGVQQAPRNISRERLGVWVEASTGAMGLEAAPFAVPYSEVEAVLERAAPALLLFEPEPGQMMFLCLGRGGSRGLALLGPDQSVRRFAVAEVAQGLRQVVESPIVAEVDPILDLVRVDLKRRARAKSLLIADRMRGRPVALGFSLGRSPTASFGRDLKAARAAPKLGLLFLGYALAYALTLLGWWFIGHGALTGRVDRGWLWAWGLSMASLIPLQAFVNWLGFDLSFSCAVLLKRRLFAGACELDTQTVRRKGLGQLLSLVLECELLESLGFGGFISGALAMIELGFAAALLLLAGNDPLLTGLLIGSLALSWGLVCRFYQHKSLAVQHRLALTAGLVETMLGHRTRLAQSPQAEWHLSEDATNAHYLRLLQRADEAGALLVSLLPRGWLVLAALALSLRAYRQVALSEWMGAVGGTLMAYAALRSLGGALPQLCEARIAWSEIQSLFQARADGPRPVAPQQVAEAACSKSAATPTPQPFLEAHNLDYGNRERSKSILSGGSLALWAGDRVILEGPSGSGKSTLAALLAGLRQPTAGIILLRGLDQHTLGLEAWRRQIVVAPQFHENHVLSAPFAFNLLMARSWPPSPADLAPAENICQELGLGPLLRRMPSGMFQMVGEMGWQLSHGERSRLFIARALLQETEVVILDESFAALDPETLQRALLCVLKRARTLVVIHHP